MSSGMEITNKIIYWLILIVFKRKHIHISDAHVCKIMKTSTLLFTVVFSRTQVIARDLYGLLIHFCSFKVFHGKCKINVLIQI